MACPQTLNGLAKDCLANIGGIVEIAIANADDVASITETSGKITAITMDASKTFKRYACAKNTCTLTSTYTIDKASGAKYVTNSLLMQFNRMETTKRTEISALALADMAVLVKTANGVWVYLGKDEPVEIAAGDGQTGAAKADANRYTITLESEEKELPLEVDATAAEAVIS